MKVSLRITEELPKIGKSGTPKDELEDVLFADIEADLSATATIGVLKALAESIDLRRPR